MPPILSIARRRDRALRRCGRGFALISGGAAPTFAFGQAINESAMPTLGKSGGIAGGGASGPATSRASVTLRGMTGNSRFAPLGRLTGTTSVGGSLGRMFPFLGTLQMFLDYLNLRRTLICVPVA